MQQIQEKELEKRLPGVSREEEEETLREILAVAQENLDQTEKYNKELNAELYEMLETYSTKDKEAMVFWNNTKARYHETLQELERCRRARKKPYFGRIDFDTEDPKGEEAYYIGKVGIAKDSLHPLVIDWRAPLASVYYENSLGKCTYEVLNEGRYEINLKRKRTYEIAEDRLIDFFDSDVVANDELLTKYLAKNKKAVLGEIIGTIQKEQNEIIRKTPRNSMIVQGVAGSGKTTVAMHRIAYILYNYEEFRPVDFYIIGSNRILLNYITGVLPDLDVYGISQMTMEQLFVRLLYEDWDEKKYQIIPLDKKDEAGKQKGNYVWFQDLEEFCREYEKSQIPREDIRLEKDGTLLMDQERIDMQLRDFPQMSMQSKINLLNEILNSKLENELLGRHISLTTEEKKELQKKYKMYFGRDEWKGSIYTLYREFLEYQKKHGKEVFVQEGFFDVYDLAALAYLYKRIKETDEIREASHVIIDEAQDFGMMAYAVLKYCMWSCTYTIMGDVSQNIHFGYGLNDWEELQKLMLAGTMGTFELLKKSYRNTVEISNFATEILRHGDFPVYPVEPILRHGKEVSKKEYKDVEALCKGAVEILKTWQKDGYETIAVICRDGEEASAVREQLGAFIEISGENLETAEFEDGIMVLPVEYAKGLEFDAVLLYDPTKEKYPGEDAYVKLLYVAATRALHELSVIHTGNLTDLIAVPVSEHKKMRSLEKKKKRLKQAVTPELLKEKQSESKPSVDFVEKQRADAKIQKELETLKKHQEEIAKLVENPIEEAPKKKNNFTRKPYQEGQNPSRQKFNSVPDGTMLKPKRGLFEASLKGVRRTKKYAEFVSASGTLRVTPIGESVVHIQFCPGADAKITLGYWDFEPDEELTWAVRKGKSHFEVAVGEIVIKIGRAAGALHFFNKKGELLLNETGDLPRYAEEAYGMRRFWQYFDWQKQEKLYARGVFDQDLIPVSKKARYISFGGRTLRMPLIVSEKHYGIGIGSEGMVMCCDIPMYGAFFYTEGGSKQLDYYFIYGENRQEILELYKKLNE